MALPRGYTFDPRTGRYRAPNGRLVPRAEIRDAVDRAIAALRRQASDVTAQLRAGTISVDEWETAMRQVVKDTHLLNMVASRGGWDQMTQADFGRVGQIVRTQYNYLGGFAAEIGAGIQPLDGRVTVRAQMYADMGRATYETDQRVQQRALGASEERSILHPADHCDDCIAEAAKGWQPIGTLIPIGERQCLSNCACTFMYQ